MRKWSLALFIGTAISLCAGATHLSREFAPHRIAQARFFDGHYETYFHKTADGRDVLMALDRKRLNLVKFDILNNATLHEERLVTGGKAPDVVSALSSRSGEFWVAFARPARQGYSIELHSDSRPEYFSIEDSQLPLSLTLAEAHGQVLLVASYLQSLIVFGRRDGQLEQIHEFTAPAQIQRTQTFVTSQGGLLLSTLSSDKIFRVYEFERNTNRLRERWKRKLSGGYVDAALNSDNEIVAALVQSDLKSGDVVRFVREKSKTLSPPVAIDLTLGGTQWIQGQNGELLLAAMARQDTQPEVRLINSQGVQFALGAGEAQVVSSISSFAVGDQSFVAFLKNQRDVLLQSESATSLIRAPQDAKAVRLSAVHKLQSGRDVIAILTDLERLDPEARSSTGSRARLLRSTRAQIVAFTRARTEAKRDSRR